MTLIKKTLVCISTVLISGTLLAKADNQEVGVGHFMLGVNFSTYSGEDWVVQGGYVNDNFLADIGFGWEQSEPTSASNFNILELRTHIGLRKKLSHNLRFDYGLLGSYSFRSVHTATRVSPYEYGVFIGLSWNATPNLMMAAKVLPYSYERAYNKGTHTRVFSEGSISINYLFG